MGRGQVISKTYIDLEVARVLGLSQRSIATTTYTFLIAARNLLSEHGAIMLDGLGKLRLVVYETGDAGNLRDRHSKAKRPKGTQKKFTVYFTKSESLTDAIRKRYRGE